MDIIDFLLHSWVIKWVETLLSISWQISILICLILVISILSRKASPIFHYFLWLIVLIRLSIPVNLKIPVGLSEVSESLDFLTVNFPIDVSDVIYAKSTSLLSVNNGFTVLWVILFLLIAATIFWRTMRLYSILRVGYSVERAEILELQMQLSGKMGFKKPIPIYSMDIDRMNGPAVIGVFRPRIYLPRWIVDKWSAEDIEPILLHELVHIRRYDCIINWLQIIVQAIYFFNPLVWLMNWKIRILREDICDDIVIDKIGAEKRRYSKSILMVVEETVRKPILRLASIGCTEDKKSLTRRIKRIMSKNYQFYRNITFSSILILMFIGIISFVLASDYPAKIGEYKASVEEKAIDLSTSYGIIGGMEALYKDLKYPEEAKRAGIEGTVRIKVLVNEDGIPKEVESGEGKKLGFGLEEAAVEAAKKQRWVKATQDGKPISFWVTIPVVFVHPEIPSFLPLEDQPKIIGGYASIRKSLKYPEKAKKAGIEGLVILKALLDKEGTVERVEVERGLGSGCSEAAIEAVKKARFTPATQKGKPVRFWFRILIRFEL